MTERTLREKIEAMEPWNIVAPNVPGGRCKMVPLEDVLALLDAHTAAQPAPDAVAEAAKVLLAVLEDPDSLPIEKHPNWQEVYDEMTADHFESIDICGRHDWPSTLTVALRAIAKGHQP